MAKGGKVSALLIALTITVGLSGVAGCGHDATKGGGEDVSMSSLTDSNDAPPEKACEDLFGKPAEVADQVLGLSKDATGWSGTSLKQDGGVLFCHLKKPSVTGRVLALQVGTSSTVNAELQVRVTSGQWVLGASSGGNAIQLNEEQKKHVRALLDNAADHVK